MKESFLNQLNILKVFVKPYIVPVLISYSIGFISAFPVYQKYFEAQSVTPVALTTISEPAPKIESNQTKNFECTTYVDVSGAVMSPGVYCLEQGKKIFDAINKAGGFNYEAYASKYVSQKINQSKSVENETKIYIPFSDDIECVLKEIEKEEIDKIVKDESTKIEDENSNDESEEGTEDENDQTNKCISLNNSSIEELDTLPGIGIATAQKIIGGRTYKSLESLKDIGGIGDATYTKILPYICL